MYRNGGYPSLGKEGRNGREADCTEEFHCIFFVVFFISISFFNFNILLLFNKTVILQLCAFSLHPSNPTQLNPTYSPTPTLPLDFVHVSFIVVPVIPFPHCPLPTPPCPLLDCS